MGGQVLAIIYSKSTSRVGLHVLVDVKKPPAEHPELKQGRLWIPRHHGGKRHPGYDDFRELIWGTELTVQTVANRPAQTAILLYRPPPSDYPDREPTAVELLALPRDTTDDDYFSPWRRIE